MKKIIALLLALIFAMNFAVVSFAGVAEAAVESESIVTEIDETADEDVEVDDVQNSWLNNDFVRFILDMIEILKSTFAFLDKMQNK